MTSRAGLAALADFIQRLRLLADRLMPAPGSSRGNAPSLMFSSFMMMKHEGAKCLEDIRHLRRELSLKKVVGLAQLPGARTLGDWLRRIRKGTESMQALVEINKRLLSAALHHCKRVTLDIDVTIIENCKRDAKFNCKGTRGYTPIIDHIAETEQVAELVFREGNAPPN